MTFHAGCLCGAVRIEIHADPIRVGICHCLDCRKRQGALFHTFAVFPSDAVTVTGETGTFKTRSFCPTCAAPLFDRFGDEFELCIGALDATDQFVPHYESWTSRREKWLPAFPLERHHEYDR